MLITNSLVLSTYLLAYVLLIVLMGVIILEYFKRKKSERKWIINFLIFVIVLTSVIVLGTYRYFGSLEGIPTTLLIILSFVLLGLFIWSLYSVWNKINKKIFFIIVFFTFLIIISKIMGIFYFNDFFELMNALGILGDMISYYFLVIKFLIAPS